MQHLLDFFDRYVHGRGTALLYDDGFRQWSYTYGQVRATAHAFASRLMDAGLLPGDRIVMWSGNRPEWAPVFWGCILRGVAVIPLDARASAEQVRLDSGTDAAAVIRHANTRLGIDRRIRDFSVWPGPTLPRTEAMRKLRRYEIRRWVAEGSPRVRPDAA